MVDYTKEQKALIAQIVNAEGWPLIKGLMNVYAADVQNQIMVSKDEESLKEAAYKFKYGVQAIVAILQELENVRDSLDKK